jgi:hypothetical protein
MKFAMTGKQLIWSILSSFKRGPVLADDVKRNGKDDFIIQAKN